MGSLANVAAALLLLLALVLGAAVCYVLVVPGADTIYEDMLNFISPSAEDIDVSQIEIKPGQPTLVPIAQLPSATPTAEFATLAPT
ncbi:MAG: hypothetical protein HC804_01145, partial [Anaerolineae bacterium]|nr:hypothetical protein [Anaerolineae bacterium]